MINIFPVYTHRQIYFFAIKKSSKDAEIEKSGWRVNQSLDVGTGHDMELFQELKRKYKKDEMIDRYY